MQSGAGAGRQRIGEVFERKTTLIISFGPFLAKPSWAPCACMNSNEAPLVLTLFDVGSFGLSVLGGGGGGG